MQVEYEKQMMLGTIFARSKILFLLQKRFHLGSGNVGEILWREKVDHSFRCNLSFGHRGHFVPLRDAISFCFFSLMDPLGKHGMFISPLFYSTYILFGWVTWVCVNVCSSDILLIGCGRRMQRVGDEVRGFLRSSGIKLETVDSVCLLYFFLPSQD